MKDWIVEKTKSPQAMRALNFCFCTPIFKSSDFIDQSKIPDATARRILTLVSGDDGQMKTLRASSGRRQAVYVFTERLNIAEGRAVF